MEKKSYHPDQERLAEVLQYIQNHKGDACAIDAKLQEELRIERAARDDYNENSYLNYLRQTDEREGNDYRMAKAKRATLLRRFVSAFDDDIREAMRQYYYYKAMCTIN